VPTRTEAIRLFLQSSTHKDLADLYNHSMECQVNVAQDGGERVDGDFHGRRWQGWTDGTITWKSFRIPYKANTEPEYTDKPITWPLEQHVEAIGMTGWDWENRVSRWVAFDFDSIVSHKDGLTNEQLKSIRRAAQDIEWATIRRSTSGKGIHIYVFVEPVETKNHNEHAALARAILGKMSAYTGYDFSSSVDICGGNMWIWHRKMANGGSDLRGLALLKSGGILSEVPPNWKDHIKVVSGRRRKVLPQVIEESGSGDLFEELTSQRPRVPLDEGHKKVIDFLKEQENAVWWWDQDHHMLVTHTYWLQKAHEEMGLKGFFKSNTQGTNLNEQNCFAYPIRGGAWSVRRYTPGVQEHESWQQDGAGWTRTFLNKDPDLSTAARAYGGIEEQSGAFVFREAEVAENAARLLGANLNVGAPMRGRETKLKQHKDGRLVALVEHKPTDMANEMAGWLPQKGYWSRIFNTRVSSPTEPEVGNYDDIVRHLVTETSEDYGWMVKSDGYWRSEPLTHIRVALGSLGLNNKEITGILGSSVFKCWRVVNKPFQEEYPGDREWNRNAAQFKFTPSPEREEATYPTWTKILNHCGSGLDDAIKSDPWCKANGLQTGGEYLKCWVASLFRFPYEPLPYLFLYGPQNSGKSVFHEAISLLLTKGYRRADAALVSGSGFNGELEGAIVAVIEETDLRKNKTAYNKIKDWVTSRDLLIHAKGKTPYHVPNTLHFIQCANDHQACPIFSGDTRITMSYVGPLEPLELIPKRKLIEILEKEAPDFLAEVLALEIPESTDRLNIPALTTEDKEVVQRMNMSQLELFLDEKCVYAPGHNIKQSDLFDKFRDWLDPNEIHKWTIIRVGRELPPNFPKGRMHGTGQFHVGNIAWASDQEPEKKDTKYILHGGYLEEINV